MTVIITSQNQLYPKTKKTAPKTLGHFADSEFEVAFRAVQRSDHEVHDAQVVQPARARDKRKMKEEEEKQFFSHARFLRR